jgi:hypothetical protein
LPLASGLPVQASIAGCLSSREQPEVWRASLERLGQEHSRVEALSSQLPTLLEERLFEGLSSAFLENVWIGGIAHPHTCREFVFLTSPYPCSGLASAWGQVYVVQFNLTHPAGEEAGTLEQWKPEAWEPIVPDTDRTYDTQQMKQAWEAIGREVTEDDLPLSFDPDDHPLF